MSTVLPQRSSKRDEVATVLEQVAEDLDVEGTLARRQGQFQLVLSITSITRSVTVEVEASDVESLIH